MCRRVYVRKSLHIFPRRVRTSRIPRVDRRGYVALSNDDHHVMGEGKMANAISTIEGSAPTFDRLQRRSKRHNRRVLVAVDHIRALAFQDRALSAAVDHYPGIVSIKDYTDTIYLGGDVDEAKLVFLSKELLISEGYAADDTSYLGRFPSEYLQDGNKYVEEDAAVLAGEHKTLTYYNVDRYGRSWLKYKYSYICQRRTLVAATLIHITAEILQSLNDHDRQGRNRGTSETS